MSSPISSLTSSSPACATSAAFPPRPSTAAATTALGIREQLIFPEIEYDKVEKIRGMEMIFVTTAKTDEEAKELLQPAGYAVAQA